VATDLLYDVPIDRLADALEPLVKHLPQGRHQATTEPPWRIMHRHSGAHLVAID
jgi:hypothetical protein